MLWVDTVSITTAADGSATVYTAKRYTGKVKALLYDGGLDAGGELTVTGENTGVRVYYESGIGAAAIEWRPVAQLAKASDGSAVVLYDYVQVVAEKLKFEVASGGNAQTGEIKAVIEGIRIED